MASSKWNVSMILDLVPLACVTSSMNVTPSVLRFLNTWSFDQPEISSWNPYALCFRPYRSLRHRKALPLGSLYLPGRFMYTGSLHGAMRNVPLMSNWCSVRFACAAIAHIVRMILYFDVGANVSPCQPGFCCLPSAYARARHSVVFPSLSLCTLNKKCLNAPTVWHRQSRRFKGRKSTKIARCGRPWHRFNKNKAIHTHRALSPQNYPPALGGTNWVASCVPA